MHIYDSDNLKNHALKALRELFSQAVLCLVLSHEYDPVEFILTLYVIYSKIVLVAMLALQYRMIEYGHMNKYEKKSIAVSYRLEPEVLAQLLVVVSLKPGTAETSIIRDLITKRYEEELKTDRDLVTKLRKEADKQIAVRIASKARKTKK